MPNPEDAELSAQARAAAAHAHSPYSGIRVGAALRTASGSVYAGCNVENASYGLTLCAERTAVAQAVAAGEREFVEIAVWSDRERVLMPCGACRQVLAEFAPALRVSCHAEGQPDFEAGLDALLPHAVVADDLA